MAKIVEFKDSAYGQINSDVAGGHPEIFDWVVVYAGQHTTIGGGVAEAKTLAGVLSTDIVLANLVSQGTTPRVLLKAVPTTDTLTFTFDGDPNTGTAHVVSYSVLRQL
jgi:hypothetical protein